MHRLGRLAALALLLAAPAAHAQTLVSQSAATPAQSSSVRYTIQATVDGANLTGDETIEIDPAGAAEMRSVVLFLFPNILSQRLPGLDSKTFFWVSPVRWRPGGMQLISITGAHGEELPWTGVDLSRREDHGSTVDLPQGTAVRVTLPEAASGTTVLHARFTLHVPERTGTFAWYRDELFLSGGWHPMVAPRDASGQWDVGGTLPRADFDVNVDLPASQWAILDRTASEPVEGAGPRRTISASVRSRPQVSLLVAARMHRAESGGLSLYQPRAKRYYSARILGVATRVRSMLLARGLIDPGSAPAPIHEAPLSRELVFHDEPVATISTRVYRMFGTLRKYEDVHVARAEVAAEMRDRVYQSEPGDDAGWVLDAVAWYLALEWQKETSKLHDPRDFLKPFGFLPAVDIVLHRPDFPFAAELYDNYYYTDFVRDDVTRFQNDRPSGRVAWEKLIDLVGREGAKRAMEAYLADQTHAGFRAICARETERDLGAFFEQWRAPLPLVNYKLLHARVRPAGDGSFVSELTLARTGSSLDEPVTVEARSRKEKQRRQWMSGEGEGTVTIASAKKPDAFQIDPDGRLYQTSLRDDRIPPTWIALLQYAFVDYEFKLNRADMGAGFTFERTNDLRNEILADAFTNQESTGGDIGFSHSVGRFSYYRGLMHRFGILAIGQHLDSGFGKKGLHVVPGFDPTLSTVRDTGSVQAFYRYDSRDDWRFPRSGGRFFIYGESGASLIGRPARFSLADVQTVRLLRLSDNNVLALEAKAGTFLGTEAKSVPLSKLFFVGGIDDVRGISAPDIIGPTRVFVSAEWRHYLLHDLDWNFYIERMRGLQGSFFVDSGYIAPRTFDVPSANNWVTSVGYGLREFYDFLGVRPQIFRVELAQRVDNRAIDRPRLDLRLYVGAGQSF